MLGESEGGSPPPDQKNLSLGLKERAVNTVKAVKRIWPLSRTSKDNPHAVLTELANMTIPKSSTDEVTFPKREVANDLVLKLRDY